MISTTTSVICIVDIQLFMEKECSICRKKYIRLQFSIKGKEITIYETEILMRKVSIVDNKNQG